MTSDPRLESFSHLTDQQLFKILRPGNLERFSLSNHVLIKLQQADLLSAHRYEPVRISSVLVEALTRRDPLSGEETTVTWFAHKYLASDTFRQSPWGKAEVASALIAKYNDPEGNTPQSARSPEKADAVRKGLIEDVTRLLVAEPGGHAYERFITEGADDIRSLQEPMAIAWINAAERLARRSIPEALEKDLTFIINAGLRSVCKHVQEESLTVLPSIIKNLPDSSKDLVYPFRNCLISPDIDVFLAAAQNFKAVIAAAPHHFLKGLQKDFDRMYNPLPTALRLHLETAVDEREPQAQFQASAGMDGPTVRRAPIGKKLALGL